jgi:sugar phosphate isomerase/epimerase
MLVEMAELGFSHVELSHGIRAGLVPGIIKAVEERIVQVSSTHNFCPLPPGVMQPAPNMFEPTGTRRDELELWLYHTKRSIDFAAKVGAKVLVCHLGHVGFFWFNPVPRLEAWLETSPGIGRTENPRYRQELERVMAKIRRRMPAYVDRLRKSVDAVLDYATACEVQLGFENRERIDELPLDDDYPEFLASFRANAPIGYWHDTGHADIKEGAGLLKHREHLEKMAPRLLGFHLHDVSADGHDHQAVGAGKIDFEMVSRFWRPEHRLTIELSPRLEPDAVLASLRRVKTLVAARSL